MEEYWGFRVGTSAVGVGIAALEYGLFCSLPQMNELTLLRYANRVRLSNSTMKDADMKAIWEETNIIISMLVHTEAHAGNGSDRLTTEQMICSL